MKYTCISATSTTFHNTFFDALMFAMQHETNTGEHCNILGTRRVTYGECIVKFRDSIAKLKNSLDAMTMDEIEFAMKELKAINATRKALRGDYRCCI